MKSIALFASLAFVLAACSKQETAAVPAETAAAKPYPLKTCIVSGEELGSMGDPVVIVHEGREIRFCCSECVPSFKEDPAKYLSKLENP
jgi:YHS domain-containing protein